MCTCLKNLNNKKNRYHRIVKAAEGLVQQGFLYKYSIRNIPLILLVGFLNFTCNGPSPFRKTQNKKIILVGINGYNPKDISTIQRILSKYTYYEASVGEPIINPNVTLYKNDGDFYMITDEIQKLSKRNTYFDYDVEEPITIYFTRYYLYNLNRSIRANTYGNQIYMNVSSFCEGQTTITILHEISHNFGLSHCESKCIMGKPKHMKWEGTFYYCDRCRPFKPEMIKNVM